MPAIIIASRRSTAAGSITIIRDTFTEAVNTDLASHTPDIGTSWSVVTSGGYLGSLRVNGTDDRVEATVSETNAGVFGLANATYPSADYAVQSDVMHLSSMVENADNVACLIARYVDADNYYMAVLYGSSLNPDVAIGKVVAGVDSFLASGNLDTLFADTFHTVRFELIGASLTLKIDGAIVLSTTDGSFSNAGLGGIGLGDIVDRLNDDVVTDWKFDNFRIETL